MLQPVLDELRKLMDESRGPTASLTYDMQHHSYELRCAIFGTQLASMLHSVRAICEQSMERNPDNRELMALCRDITDTTWDLDCKVGDG